MSSTTTAADGTVAITVPHTDSAATQRAEDHNEQQQPVETPEDPANDDNVCRYSSKPCTNPRAVKKTGDLHSFCEFHREMANRNQRRCEQKRRTKRQLEKLAHKRALHAQPVQLLMGLGSFYTPRLPMPSHKRRRRSESPTSIEASILVESYRRAATVHPASLPSTDLEPFLHPVQLHDEDLQFLFMTMVDAADPTCVV